MKMSEMGILNDMPRGWRTETPYNRKIYKMWCWMWYRVYIEPSSKDYEYYKDSTACEDWRLLSNYVDFIQSQSCFDDFKINYSNYCMDKDSRVLGNKHYSPETCTLMLKSDNAKEVNDRLDSPFERYNIKYHPHKRPVLAIHKDDPKIILLYDAITAVKRDGFDASTVSRVIKNEQRHHKGFKWKNLNYWHNKIYRVKKKQSMIIAGIDASFTRLGYTIIDVDNKLITIDNIPGKRGNNFQVVFQNAFKKSVELIRALKDYNIDYLIIEEPFIGREASEGLFLLDGILNYSLILKGVKEIYNTNPSYLKTLHGFKYTKSDSVELGKVLKRVYENHGYSFNKSKLNDDESESFIFATRLFIRKEVDVNLNKDLILAKPKLELEKEKLLYCKN